MNTTELYLKDTYDLLKESAKQYLNSRHKLLRAYRKIRYAKQALKNNPSLVEQPASKYYRQYP
jgi:hypothetical protein